MARLNKAQRYEPEYTHEGAPAARIDTEKALERSVMSCFLWENEFYEDGVAIADRITELANKCDPEFVADLAIHARHDHNLRHAPLLLLEALTRIGKGRMVGDTINQVISRADEPGEFLAICKARGMKTLSKQMKVGLGRSLKQFDEYQLAKYNRNGEFKIRDVLFLSHPYPNDDAQAELFRRLVDDELEVPDTWETNLSGGADKKETFERLLSESKLGYLALLRNLRNMSEAGVDEELIRKAILTRRGARKVLPFRFVSAAKAAPRFERYLDQALVATIKEMPKLKGKTIVLVDVSGSMDWGRISAKSDLTRRQAAATLASMIDGDVRVFTFANDCNETPHRLGMAGVDAICNVPTGGTYLGGAIERVNREEADRLIVITDEQSHDRVGDPNFEKAYMINVASNKNGVGYGKRWTHIDGFSESVIRFILEKEAKEP